MPWSLLKAEYNTRIAVQNTFLARQIIIEAHLSKTVHHSKYQTCNHLYWMAWNMTAVIFHEVFQHSVAQLKLSPYKACRNYKPALSVQHDLFCKGTDCVCPYFTACLAHVRFWFYNCLKSTQEFHAFLKVISSIKELSVSEHAPYI